MPHRLLGSPVPRLLAALFGLLTLSAHATTFTLYNLGSAYFGYGFSPVGFIGSNFVVENYLATTSYIVYTPGPGGLTASYAATRPGPLNSFSTSCSPGNATGLVSVEYALCNGAYQALLASPDGVHTHLYEENGGAPSEVTAEDASVVILNNDGEIAYLGEGPAGSGGIGYLAVPAQTPEPSSLLLLGTGVLGVGGLLRRRLTSSIVRPESPSTL